ncbi:hypothetical protein [Streptomyces zhihengii]|uniref:Secreted protein n=1 Tax=Streptomyces zhihengii TaxID=1818004 RepID=A0ABS2UQH7_9ACTN|nr:hypothetical protein [Streptomyces zhihengii]MBM9619639.1 hypothetical protein [Streptomyces zhihengii]
MKKWTTRGSLAVLVACAASAVGAAPALAGTSVPVTVPLESVEAALPVDAPALSTGVPVPVPGAPEGPRHVTGNLLPQNTLPAVPFTGELPETLLELPVENPLGEGRLGVAQVASEASDLTLASPGASVGAPLTQPRAELLGQPEATLPQAGLVAPVLQGSPAAGLLLN